MTRLDARPEALDVAFRPGSTVTLNLNGPAGWLTTRDFTATLNGTSLSVSESGDTLIVSASAAITGPLSSPGVYYPFLLHRTGGNAALVGSWQASNNAAAATTVNATVLVEELDVAITILGSGEGGSGGVVDTIVAGDGIDVDSTDPQNPIVSATATGTGTVDSVVAGHGVDVDATDPANPIVSVDETELSLPLIAGVLVDGQIPSAIARDTEVTAAVAAEATLARNGDNITSGTVADLRIAGTIARDSEVTSAIAALSTVYQPLDSDLTAVAALTTTVFGRALLTQADAAATRTTLGLGTAATTASSAYDVAGAAAAAQAASQPLDSDLTAIAALATTTFGRALLVLADASAGRAALALGTSSTVDTGTTSGTIPLLSTGGVLPIARLATGTPTGAKFVRDDGTLAIPAGGGSGVVVTVVAGTAITVDSTDPANPIVSVTASTFQPLDSDLTTIAGLTATTDSFIQSKASAWASRTVAQVKTDLGLTGTNSGDQTVTLTGDVTGSGTSSFAATIASHAVTNAKSAQMVAHTYKGNNTGSTADPIDVTLAQLKTELSLSGGNTGDQTITLTGDVTGSGTGSFAATLKNTGPGATGPIGDATHVPVVTIDGQGRVTALTSTAITGGATDKLGLTPTAVKTANYTAAAGDLVPCDTSGGAFAVTFPTAPADGTVLAVKLVTAGNTLTLTLGGSDVFNKAGTTSGSLTLTNQGVLCQYKATGAIWYVVADDLTLAVLDARFQGLDSDLTTIAGLTATTDSFMQSKSSAWAARTVAQVKTDLGLTGTNSGDQTITLTGDVTGSGTGSFAATLKNTGPGATGPLGSATVSPIVTIDAQGRVTALSSATIAIPESAVTNLTSDLAAKAPLASPALTGHPTGVTETAGDNSTRLASTAYADALISDTAYNASTWDAVTGIAPSKNAVRDQIVLLATLASPTFTGTPAAPTAAQGTNTTQVATTAMVQSEVTLLAPKASPTFTGTPAAPTASQGTNTTQLATTAFVVAGSAPLVSQLKATAVKTANYTAAAGDFVPLDTTSGTPIIVTLPTAPADGTAIGIKWVLGANATATYVTGGSDVLNKAGGSTTGSLLVVNQEVLLRYASAAAIWYVQTSFSKGGLDTTYAPFAKRVTSITSSATPTFNTDTCDIVNITALAAAITSMVTNKTGTPTDGQKLEFRILDNGTARAITWGADYITQCSFALPTTTVLSKKLRCGFEWDPAVSKWALIALSQET